MLSCLLFPLENPRDRRFSPTSHVSREPRSLRESVYTFVQDPARPLHGHVLDDGSETTIFLLFNLQRDVTFSSKCGLRVPISFCQS